MKKIISFCLVISVLLNVFMAIQFLGFYESSQNNKDLDEVLNGDLSNYDITVEIEALTDDVKKECKALYEKIEILLSELENDEMIGRYFSKGQLVLAFDNYYGTSMKKIESDFKFFEMTSTIEYLSGSYRSIALAEKRYELINDFKTELQELYSWLATNTNDNSPS